jgi:hypothetical protein
VFDRGRKIGSGLFGDHTLQTPTTGAVSGSMYGQTAGRTGMVNLRNLCNLRIMSGQVSYKAAVDGRQYTEKDSSGASGDRTLQKQWNQKTVKAFPAAAY